MYQFLLLIHVLTAICIIAVVLVQQGKGATLGAAFGSGASQTVFGSRGSGSFLFRFTIGLAAVFFITSIALNSLAMHSFRQQRDMNMPILPPVPAKTAPANVSPAAPPAPVPAGIPIRK